MKSLLKLSLATFGLLVASLPAVNAADTAATPTADTAVSKPAKTHAGHGRRHARLRARHNARLRARVAHKLGLSDAQREQLKAARTATASSLKAIRADTSLTPDQKKARVRETLANSRTQMRNVLTPEQQAQLQKLRRHARQGHGT